RLRVFNKPERAQESRTQRAQWRITIGVSRESVRMEPATHIQEINQKVRAESGFVQQLVGEVHRVIVGQKYMVERLVIGLVTRGHILLEGVPGLAKTLAVRTLSAVIDARFQRIQFTPDLLPADLI